MGNCKTCKHWGEIQAHKSGLMSQVAECEKIPMYWEATDWDDNGKRIFKDDSLAFVQDGSDYCAYLLTKENFGCAMYEPK